MKAIAHFFGGRALQPASEHLLASRRHGAIDRFEDRAFRGLGLAIEQQFELGDRGKAQMERVEEVY